MRIRRTREVDSGVGDDRSRLVSALVPSDMEGISTLSSMYSSKGGKTGQARALRSGAPGHLMGEDLREVEDDERGDIVSRSESLLAVRVRIGMGKMRMIQIEGQEASEGNSHGDWFYL